MDISKNIGFIALHYGGAFFREALMSVVLYVDKIHVAYSPLPSQGFSTEEKLPESESESTLYGIAKEVCGDKLVWIKADGFGSEDLHRQERYRFSVGKKYIVVFDSDEVLQNIPEAIEYAEQNNQRFYGAAGFRHFIKSDLFCFVDDQRPIRVEKLTVDNLDQNLNMPLEVFHYSLCQPIELFHYKMAVSGHHNEFRPEFYQRWLDWSSERIDEITDLHPTIPGLWEKPIVYSGKLPKSVELYKPKPMSIKVLYIPLDWNRHSETPDLFQDTIDSINRLGTCKIYNGDIAAAIQFKPNVVLFQGSASTYELGQIKEETGALMIMFSGDCRYSPPQSLIDYSKVIDLYLLPFSGNLLTTYQTLLGKPCHFLWEYIQNWRFVPPKMMDEMSGEEIVFVGNKYQDLPGIEPRNDLDSFITKLSSHPVELFGSGFKGGEVPNTLVPSIYNKAYAVIAENNYTVEGYFTPRNIGGLAAGSCVLMKYFPGIERFFQNNFHCLYYRDKYELLELISFVKRNPTIRNNIASQGFGLASEKFTMDAWAKELFNIIKNYIK